MIPDKQPQAAVATRPPAATIVLVVLAVLGVLAAAGAVAYWHGWSASPAGPAASRSTTPTRVPIVADRPCTWLAAADVAAEGLPAIALSAYAPPVGLQPAEVYCVGSAGVSLDLRWSIDGTASSAHTDFDAWVGQLTQSGWTVRPAVVTGAAGAQYVSAVLDASGRPTPAAEMLVQVGALRIVVQVPAATPDAAAVCTTLAARVVERVTSIQTITGQAVTAPPSPPSSTGAGG